MVIPEGITHIGESAFSASGITSLTLPSTIKEHGYGAFNMCRSLTTVNIPQSVGSIQFISAGGFWQCENIDLASQARLRQVGYTGPF